MTKSIHARNRSNSAAVAVIAAMAMMTAGCSSISGLWGGGDDNVILQGDRVSVMTSEQSITVDPEASKEAIVVPAAFTNAEWSQPGGTASNALQHVALGGKLTRLWSTSAGSGSSSHGRLTASPIVFGNRIFTLDTEATVHAIEAASGKRLWSVALTPEEEESDEGYGGGLAAEGGRLFVSIGFGHVVALDPSTGKQVWRKPLGVPIRSAPTAAGGRVYVTTINNEVYALSQADGEVSWKYQGIAETAALLSSTSPAVSQGRVIVPYTSGEIIAFETSTGNPLWTDSLTRAGGLSSLANINAIAGRPVIDKGTVFAISHSGRMAAFDLSSGERRWTQDIAGTQTPWVAGSYVFLVSERGELMALSKRTGGAKWVQKLGSDAQWSGPVLAGGRLILVSSKGIVRSISPQNGQTVDTINLGESMMISPVVAGNTIYFYTDGGDLVAMR